MDIRSIFTYQKSTDSCLSESWNIVGTHDVNSGSEGSDGESIEVIEEESQVDSYPKTLWESAIAENAEIPECLPSQEKSQMSETNRNKGRIAKQNKRSNSNNFFTSCCTFLLVTSVFISSASVPFFFTKQIEELYINYLNLHELKYIFSYKLDNSGNEYQELLGQIKTYKEESQDLRGIVADLNAAVTSLKKELAAKNVKQIPDNFADKNLNNENKLIDQLFNIQTNDLPDVIDSKANEETYEKSFKLVKDLLKQLTDGDENLEILERVKLFYLIPKHLDVLGRHYSRNENISQFINFWKEKLHVDIKNLILDVKEMQSKVIRLTVKHLNNIEKLFFTNLCNLLNINENKAKCSALFIKTYDNSDVPLIDEKLVNGKVFSKAENDIKSIFHHSYDLNTNDNFAKGDNLENHIKLINELKMKIKPLASSSMDEKAHIKDKSEKSHEDKAEVADKRDKDEEAYINDRAEEYRKEDEAEESHKKEKAEVAHNEVKANEAHNMDKAEEAHKKEKPDVAHNKDKVEVAHYKEKPDVAHNMDKAEEVHKKEKAEVAQNKDKCEKAHNEDKVEVAHYKEKPDVAHNMDKAEEVHKKEKAEVALNKDKCEKADNMDKAEEAHKKENPEVAPKKENPEVAPKDKAEEAHDKDKTEKAHDEDKTEEAHDKDTAETAHNKDMEETTHNKEMAETAHNKDKAEKLTVQLIPLNQQEQKVVSPTPQLKQIKNASNEKAKPVVKGVQTKTSGCSSGERVGGQQKVGGS